MSKRTNPRSRPTSGPHSLRRFPPREAQRRLTEDDQASSHDKGHGRVEVRRIWTTTRLNSYLDWPGVAQVCLIERTRRRRGQQSVETIVAITSLTRQQASAAELLRIARDHWKVENRLHWVRDMSFGEDACRVRTRAAPQVLAALRNAGVGLLRAWGVGNIAAALRRHAAKPMEAIRMILRAVPT